MQTCIHSCIYIHIYIHGYIHTRIHIHTYQPSPLAPALIAYCRHGRHPVCSGWKVSSVPVVAERG